jgi:hypothetical protein
MGTLMPFAGKVGVLSNLAFIISSVVVYDALTAGIGSWTWVTALVYAIVSVGAALYFKNLKATRRHFIGFALIATLVFDALTGLTLGPIFFGQSFAAAFYGQVPFTLAHLSGNFLVAAFVSPLIQVWLEKPSLQPSSQTALKRV